MDKLRHKETFEQRAYQGIPGHWVVQYYNGNSLQAEYFKSLEAAEAFEKENGFST